MDIIVTTPAEAKILSEAQAAECIKSHGGEYVRRFTRRPCNIDKGDKVFFVEDGFIRGYCVVNLLVWRNGVVNKLTGWVSLRGYYVYLDASSWKWIRPVRRAGFKGYRRARNIPVEIIGGWLDPYPGRHVPYSCPVQEAMNYKPACVWPCCNCKWLFDEQLTSK